MISPNKMVVLAEYPAVDILPRLGLGKGKSTFETSSGPFRVKIGTPRLECLRRNQSCVWCGKTGTFFRLEMSKPRGSEDIVSHHHGACYIEECPWCSLHPIRTGPRMDTPHLNLYHQSRRGALFLMTQDHILPRSRGGKDHIDNLQTMCDSCNGKKGNRLDIELTPENMACGRRGLKIGNQTYVVSEASLSGTSGVGCQLTVATEPEDQACQVAC